MSPTATTQKLGGVTSASVKKHTQKDWDEWVKTLNRKSYQSKTHQNLVQILKKEFKLTPWWQQVVARGYQIAIGVRDPNATLKGTFTTTATISLSVSAKEIFKFMTTPEGQLLWLKPLYPITLKSKETFECEGGVFGEFRTVSSPAKIRFTWIDEDWLKKSTVNIFLYSKPKKKTMIVINHNDLPTMKAKLQMHQRWRTAVDSIAEALD